MSLLHNAELKRRNRMEALAGTQNRRWKRGVIRRVGEVLCLEAEAVAPFVDASRLAGDRAVEKISCVELNPRFGRGHVERPSAGWILQPCGVHEPRTASIQDPVVIVPVAVLQLRIIAVDPRADR